MDKFEKALLDSRLEHRSNYYGGVKMCVIKPLSKLFDYSSPDFCLGGLTLYAGSLRTYGNRSTTGSFGG